MKLFNIDEKSNYPAMQLNSSQRFKTLIPSREIFVSYFNRQG